MDGEQRQRREQMERRTLEFSGQMLDFVLPMPSGPVRDVLGWQMLRSATSVGANYREANRGASRADFINKVNIAEKEASETVYWLELCELKKLGTADLRSKLLQEANELLAILVAIGRTAKANSQ